MAAGAAGVARTAELCTARGRLMFKTKLLSLEKYKRKHKGGDWDNNPFNRCLLLALPLPLSSSAPPSQKGGKALVLISDFVTASPSFLSLSRFPDGGKHSGFDLQADV